MIPHRRAGITSFDGESPLSVRVRKSGVSVACLGLVAATFATGVAEAQTPQALLEQYRCYICHDDAETRTGPAYADVAAKYRHDPKAVAVLAALLRKGIVGDGPWHMPPHPEISDAGARTIARYILSLDK